MDHYFEFGGANKIIRITMKPKTVSNSDRQKNWTQIHNGKKFCFSTFRKTFFGVRINDNLKICLKNWMTWLPVCREIKVSGCYNKLFVRISKKLVWKMRRILFLSPYTKLEQKQRNKIASIFPPKFRML